MKSQFTPASLEMVISGVNAGIWDWEIETGKQVWSDRLFELLGYEPDEDNARLRGIY
jgi:PAS domain-containing protein